MKLFIGIELPEKIKREIDQALSPIRENSRWWENCHDYHLTLLFIGEATGEQQEIVKQRMDQFIFKPFQLKTDGFKFFSRRVLFLDFVPSTELEQLHEEIDRQFFEWVRPNDKKFIPHVTVKRWQRYEFEKLKKDIEKIELREQTLYVDSIVLFMSEINSEFQKYHIIHRSPFKTL